MHISKHLRRRAESPGCRMNREAFHREHTGNDTRPQYVCGFSDAHVHVYLLV